MNSPQDIQIRIKKNVFFSTIFVYAVAFSALASLIITGVIPVISGLIGSVLGFVFLGITLYEFNPWGNSHC